MRSRPDRRLLAAGMGLLFVATSAPAVSWSPEDRANAIARERDFLVVKEGGRCVLKQSYHDDPGHMELVFQAGDEAPTLVTPYLSTPEKVVYEVDPPDEIPANEMPVSSMVSSTRMRLPGEVINAMKGGRRLKVMARINGRWSRAHTLSLMGFSSGLDVLQGPQCD